MLEGEPGTLEPREELTLPGEVSGCWGEREGGRVGMCVRARAGRWGSAAAGSRGGTPGAGTRGFPRPLGPGVRRRGQPAGGTIDASSDPPPGRGGLAPPRPRQLAAWLGAAPTHLLQPFHTAGSRPIGSPAGACTRGETTGRQALPGSWALRTRCGESRKGVPAGCGGLIPQWLSPLPTACRAWKGGRTCQRGLLAPGLGWGALRKTPGAPENWAEGAQPSGAQAFPPTGPRGKLAPVWPARPESAGAALQAIVLWLERK